MDTCRRRESSKISRQPAQRQPPRIHSGQTHPQRQTAAPARPETDPSSATRSTAQPHASRKAHTAARHSLHATPAQDSQTGWRPQQSNTHRDDTTPARPANTDRNRQTHQPQTQTGRQRDRRGDNDTPGTQTTPRYQRRTHQAGRRDSDTPGQSPKQPNTHTDRHRHHTGNARTGAKATDQNRTHRRRDTPAPRQTGTKTAPATPAPRHAGTGEGITKRIRGAERETAPRVLIHRNMTSYCLCRRGAP